MPPSWAAIVPFYFEFPKDLIRESGGRRKLVGQAKMERLRLFEMAIQCSQLSVDKVDPCRLLISSAPKVLMRSCPWLDYCQVGVSRSVLDSVPSQLPACSLAMQHASALKSSSRRQAVVLVCITSRSWSEGSDPSNCTPQCCVAPSNAAVRYATV